MVATQLAKLYAPYFVSERSLESYSQIAGRKTKTFTFTYFAKKEWRIWQFLGCAHLPISRKLILTWYAQKV